MMPAGHMTVKSLLSLPPSLPRSPSSLSHTGSLLSFCVTKDTSTRQSTITTSNPLINKLETHTRTHARTHPPHPLLLLLQSWPILAMVITVLSYEHDVDKMEKLQRKCYNNGTLAITRIIQNLRTDTMSCYKSQINHHAYYIIMHTGINKDK